MIGAALDKCTNTFLYKCILYKYSIFKPHYENFHFVLVKSPNHF